MHITQNHSVYVNVSSYHWPTGGACWENFPLGIITFRAAQRGLFELAAILRFCWFKNIEKKLTCVHACLIPVLVAEHLIATSVRRARRTEPSWFAVWKGRSGSRQITTRNQEAFSDF